MSDRIPTRAGTTASRPNHGDRSRCGMIVA